MAAFQIHKRAAIDQEKWDACISRTGHKMAYGYCGFLDAVCAQWMGVVWGDYHACLPLPFIRKFGGKWLVTPSFVQQVNIYGDTALVDFPALQVWMNKTFSLVLLNSGNVQLNGILPKARINFTIDLQKSYEALYGDYQKPAQKNLRKARNCALTMKKDIALDLVIDTFHKAYGQLSGATNEHYARLRNVHECSNSLFWVRTYGVYKEEELIFAGALLFDQKSIYYALGAPTSEGRKCSATYYFIDSILREYVGKSLIFDFEGSDLENVATFYKSFGPEKETYFFFYKNNYPFPLNHLISKKLKIK